MSFYSNRQEVLQLGQGYGVPKAPGHMCYRFLAWLACGCRSKQNIQTRGSDSPRLWSPRERPRIQIQGCAGLRSRWRPRGGPSHLSSLRFLRAPGLWLCRAVPASVFSPCLVSLALLGRLSWALGPTWIIQGDPTRSHLQRPHLQTRPVSGGHGLPRSCTRGSLRPPRGFEKTHSESHVLSTITVSVSCGLYRSGTRRPFSPCPG